MPRFGGMGGAFGHMGGGGKVPAAAVAGLSNAETTTWINAVVADGGSVSAGRQTLVDNLITSLKSGSVWTTRDAIYLYAAENSQSSLRDIKTALAATAVNSPTFTIDRGYAGNGTTSYVDTNYNPTTFSGASFVQDSACFGGWCLTSAQTATNSLGEYDGTDGCTLVPRDAADTAHLRINQTLDSIGTASASTDGSGLWSANRSGANASEFYRNASELTVATNPDRVSVAVNNLTFSTGRISASLFGTQQWACFHAGGSMNSTAQTAFYNALLTYMQAVGAA